MVKFFSDCPFHGQKFQLNAAVEGAVLFTWPEVLTGIGYDMLFPSCSWDRIALSLS